MTVTMKKMMNQTIKIIKTTKKMYKLIYMYNVHILCCVFFVTCVDASLPMCDVYLCDGYLSDVLFFQCKLYFNLFAHRILMRVKKIQAFIPITKCVQIKHVSMHRYVWLEIHTWIHLAIALFFHQTTLRWTSMETSL